jgi:hypothetical protein
MKKIKSLLGKIFKYLPTAARVIHTAVLLYLDLS